MKLFTPFTTGRRHTGTILSRLTRYYLRNQVTTSGPTTLRVEITNHCNFECLMCDHGSLRRAKVLMKQEVFEHIVDDAVASGVQILGMNRFGESTLHPRLVPMAKYAKIAGIPIVNMTTNASLLTEKLAREIIESDAFDSIACSVDGNTKTTFEQVRTGKAAIFERVVENIERLIAIRNASGRSRPHIQINTVVMDKNIHEFPDLVRRWENIVDSITVLPVKEFGSISGIAARRFRKPDQRGTGKCPYLSYMLVAYSDGQAGVCCLDSEGVIKVGDFKTQSIGEIWNGPAIKRVRQMHAERDFNQLPVCANCDLTYPARHHVKGYAKALWLRATVRAARSAEPACNASCPQRA